MAEVTGRGLHGAITDNPLLRGFLDAGNYLRYGMSEDDRQEMVRRLQAPGVKEAAYDERGIFDPAAAERYTSAYLFGKLWGVPEGLQPLLHKISSGGRKSMHASPTLRKLFGVGEERPALENAEELGMRQGAGEVRGARNTVRRGLEAPAGQSLLRGFLSGMTRR